MGRSAVLRAACVVFAAAGGAGAAAESVVMELPPETRDLDAYRWSHRPVLLFAPGPEDAAYQRQVAELRAARDGLAEREIVVLADTRPAAEGALRARLGIEGFEVLLVGKDGGVKLRQADVLTSQALFATIDAMPMRRREMRE